MLTSATQCTAKERWNQRRTKHWHLCQRIRMLTPLQHNALQRALTSAEQMGSVSEDQDSPPQHNALQRAQSAQNKPWHLCQRIRMLTPLQHNALQRALESAQNKRWHLCQRIRNADSSATHCTAKRARMKKHGICVRGSGMLTSANTMHLRSAGISAEQTWHLCQRIRNADSSATQCITKER
jgi:hypothetical protein